MSNDEILRALLDPTAPLPTGWPDGLLGAFLLFLFPLGGGIPLGVLMAHNHGASPLLIAAIYLGSDLIAALTNEPLLRLLIALGRAVPPLGALGRRFSALTHRVSGAGGARGPLGLVLVSFSVSLFSGRAAAAAAGYRTVPGWALAITGDMLYFGLLMTSTLWLSSVLGDQRLTVGLVLVLMLVLPSLLRRLRRPWEPAPVALALEPAPALALSQPVQPPAVRAASRPPASHRKRARSRRR